MKFGSFPNICHLCGSSNANRHTHIYKANISLNVLIYITNRSLFIGYKSKIPGHDDKHFNDKFINF